MTGKTIRFERHHENGETDELLEISAGRAFVPRVGEFVSIYPVVNGYVYDVNYIYTRPRTDKAMTAEAVVCIACKGGPEFDCACPEDNIEQYR